jgi:putative transposase
VSYVEIGYQMSERHACRLLGLGRSTHRYRARKGERDTALRARLKELAARRMRFGYRRLTAMLEREGMSANHKRVSIGYINARIRGYERRDANCTVLTACVLRVRSRACSTGTAACRTTPNRR